MRPVKFLEENKPTPETENSTIERSGKRRSNPKLPAHHLANHILEQKRLILTTRRQVEIAVGVEIGRVRRSATASRSLRVRSIACCCQAIAAG